MAKIHHTKVKKAQGIIGTEMNPEAITKLLLENKFTEDEIGKLLPILQAPSPESDNDGIPGADKKPSKPERKGNGYEEWRCEIKVVRNEAGNETGRVPEKIKRLRPCVKITEQEADTLNNAALYSPRADLVIMYFKPE